MLYRTCLNTAVVIVLAATLGLTLAGCPVVTSVHVVPGQTDGAQNIGQGNTTQPPATTTPGEFPDCSVPAQEADWAAQVLQLVNQESTSRGLNPLQANALLAREADVQACDMIHYAFVNHVNPVTGSTPTSRLVDSGYPGQTVGENLAGGLTTPQAVMAAWMASPDHEENILRPQFTDLGVGIRLGGTYGIYWVQFFGGP